MSDRGLATFRIEPRGPYARVEVNGRDVSDQLAGYRLEHVVGQVPTLVLFQLADAGTLEGEGIVHVAGELTDEQRAGAIVEFLSSLDPEMVDRVAFASMGLGDKGGTAAILETMCRIARGENPLDPRTLEDDETRMLSEAPSL